MKKLFLVIFAVFATATLTSSADGQAPKRVNFERGMDRTVVTDTLRSYSDVKRFVLRVRKGQKLTTENIGKNYITVEIIPPKGSKYEPDLSADCHDRHEVDPTAGGDYIILVVECRKANRWRGTFRLRVTVK